jgi:excisionase family DNA binding protein
MDNPFLILEERMTRIESLLWELKNNFEIKDSDNLSKNRPVTTKQLCEYLDVTEPTILRWRKKGKIPFFTIGNAVRFHLSEVLTALEKNKCK